MQIIFLVTKYYHETPMSKNCVLTINGGLYCKFLKAEINNKNQKNDEK